MNSITNETAIRMLAGLGFVFIFYAVWLGQKCVPGLPGGYETPVLALELVKDETDIRAIVKDPEVREFLKRSVIKDYGFIVIYAVFFAGLGGVLGSINVPGRKGIGWTAAAFAILAAILDLIENHGMLKAIAGSASNSLADTIRYASLAKWGCLFLFSLFVGVLLICRRDLFAFPGGFFLLAALCGLIAVIQNLRLPKFYPLIAAAVGLLGLGIVILATALLFAPEKLLTKFPPLNQQS